MLNNLSIFYGIIKNINIDCLYSSPHLSYLGSLARITEQNRVVFKDNITKLYQIAECIEEVELLDSILKDIPEVIVSGTDKNQKNLILKALYALHQTLNNEWEALSILFLSMCILMGKEEYVTMFLNNELMKNGLCVKEIKIFHFDYGVNVRVKTLKTKLSTAKKEMFIRERLEDNHYYIKRDTSHSVQNTLRHSLFKVIFMVK